jgi:pilus assembly protein CpaC
LRGTVATEADAAQAEKVASAFVGQVINLLQVRAPEPPTLAPTLAELQTALGNEAITVRTLGDAVLLQGTVGSEAEKEAAEKIAGACSERVVNALQVQEESLPDEVLTAQLKELIDSPSVDVHVVRGRPVLRGVVASQAEAQGLEEIASAYSQDVINLLRVQEPPTPDRAEQINQVLAQMGVSAQQVDQTVILQGEVQDEQTLKEVEEVARVLGANVVNLVRVADPSQVKVAVQIMEINRRALKDLGVDWNEAFAFGEAILSGAFKRLSTVEGTLHTLLENGQAKLLSAPTLTVLSGNEAKILVGGRIPIPTTTFLTGTPQGQVQTRQADGGGFFGGIGQGVAWEEFGVRLHVTPVVDGGEVRVEIRPEVSSLDKVNAIRIQDTVIPAIQTRQSETTVQVRSGQAIVIGGLIQNDVTETLRKFPLLGDIPLLGELFKSKKFEHKETELVITVTPTILPEEAE